VSKLDSTYLKRQQRGRQRDLPVAHFPVHLGVNCSGRKRRYARRGSSVLGLQNKRWIVSAQRLALFGRRLAWQRLRHCGQTKCEVILSNGDEGSNGSGKMNLLRPTGCWTAGTSRERRAT
jgi:hypothetical protein